MKQFFYKHVLKYYTSVSAQYKYIKGSGLLRSFVLRKMILSNWDYLVIFIMYTKILDNNIHL